MARLKAFIWVEPWLFNATIELQPLRRRFTFQTITNLRQTSLIESNDIQAHMWWASNARLAYEGIGCLSAESHDGVVRRWRGAWLLCVNHSELHSISICIKLLIYYVQVVYILHRWTIICHIYQRKKLHHLLLKNQWYNTCIVACND